jgi:hypothetical protein
MNISWASHPTPQRHQIERLESLIVSMDSSPDVESVLWVSAAARVGA